MTFTVTLERSARRRFGSELRALLDLAPVSGLVPLTGGGIDEEGRPYVEHDGVETNLGDQVSAGGPMALDEAVAAVAAVLRGLAVLHDLGLVHGGVRPSAVVAGAAGPALAYPIPPVVAERIGAVAPAFASPETLRGEPPAPAADVFSGAATLVYLGTGHAPWSEPGADAETVLLRQASGIPPDLGSFDQHVALAAAVRTALALDPAHRPTASRLASALALVGGLDGAGDPDHRGELATRPPVGTAGPAAPPTPAAPAEGSPIGSQYVLRELIGEGASGRVYRATCRDAPDEVAVKLLHGELTEDPTFVNRFLAERDALVSIHHPNVVQVRDLVVEGSTHAIVMDLVDGPNLRRWLRTAPPLPPAPACRLLAQLADALAAVHAAGVVHRDLKPENVLLERVGTEDLQLQLTDFGIARSRVAASTLTRLDQLLGTPEYLAPEVLAGQAAGPPADVYAFGVLAHELLVGCRPFEAEHPAALVHAHRELAPQRPAGLDDALWTLLGRCLDRDPVVRPGAEVMAHELVEQASALAGAAPLPRASPRRVGVPSGGSEGSLLTPAPLETQPGTAPPPPRPPRHIGHAGAARRRRLVVAALVVGLGLGAGTAVGVWTSRDHRSGAGSSPERSPEMQSVPLVTTGARLDTETINLQFDPVDGAVTYVVVRDYDPAGGGVPMEARPLEGASFVHVSDEENDVQHCYVVLAVMDVTPASTTTSTRPAVLQPYCPL